MRFLITVFILALSFVFGLLAKQWLINMPLENAKLAIRVMIINPKKIVTFHFPIKNPDLINNRITLEIELLGNLTHYFVLCELHFEEHFISRTQRCNLKWQLNPVTTIYSTELLKSSSSLSISVTKKVTYSESISRKWDAKFPWPRYNFYIW